MTASSAPTDFPASHDEPRVTHRGGARPPAVLAASASSMAATVVDAVARATGVLPIVIEAPAEEDKSLLRAAERSLPSDAIAVVAIEVSTPSALIALGYCAGVLGAERVIPVCAPEVPTITDLADFACVTVGSDDEWRRKLRELLEGAGFPSVEVVTTRL